MARVDQTSYARGVVTLLRVIIMTTCVALLENLHTPKITNIQFGLMDPDVIRRQSVVQVVRPTLYVRQLPASGGLNDLRMGTSDRRLPCGTCKNDVLSCVGHPGHIELALPVYHVSMINIVAKVLRCVCFFCSRLLVPHTDTAPDPRFFEDRFRNSDSKDKLNLVVNFCKTRHFCAHCRGPQPKYTQVRSVADIRTEFRPKDLPLFTDPDELEFVSRPFTAAMARAVLSFIPDHEVALMGMNSVHARPEWMILTVFQVPPPISRPSIMATDGSRARGQDDITIKLQDIVKANITLENAIKNSLRVAGGPGPGPSCVDDGKTPVDVVAAPAEHALPPFMQLVPAPVKSALELLQQHLVQFMHHDTASAMSTGAGSGGGGRAGAQQRNNRLLRLIPARLKGKKGRFRGTLGGKRVDYSARTVVSPAPTYDIHEVGVPQAIAQHLTFPERVNELNRVQLTQRVRNGPHHPDGASTVIMSDGTVLDLVLYVQQKKCHNFQLQIGWVVERFLRDGDWVLFNRQPSLHRMSIMAHQIRITHDKTFRLPVCDTTPYNADFDGDEMNLHVLRSYEAIAEAQELMSVTSQLLSPQSNKPIIGLVQDSLVSAFLLTGKDTFLTRPQIMQIVMPIKYPHFQHLPLPAVLKPEPLWTGKQLFSLLFPLFSLDLVVRNGSADGVLKNQNGTLDSLERRVVIRRGQLYAGSLCKKTLGTSAGGIIHVLVKDFGNTVAARFIGDAQRILVEFMMLRGFSVGIGDCMMAADTHVKVNASIDRCLAYADKMVRDARAGDAPPHLVNGCLTKLMNGALNRTGAVVQQEVDPSNNVLTMVQSGAKGSAVNIAQILACVGQQSVEGGRIAPDVDGRTLPCFTKRDTSAESRGFVANSYGTGLTAQEYFFHAMGGREGLVDTAVKTASTGYIQRRLVKAEEGLQVRYDHSVRNTREQIVQFYYGGDSFDAVYVEKQVLRTYSMSDDELRARYSFSRDELVAAVVAPPGGSVTDVGAADPDRRPFAFEPWVEAQLREVATLFADRDEMRAAKVKIHGSADPTVHVTVCVERVLERAVVRFGISRRAVSDLVHPAPLVDVVSRMTAAIQKLRRRRSASAVTLAYVRSVFCLRTIVLTYRLTLEAVRWCASEIMECYRASLTCAGEMVGTLGAASIGEPCTQMTLNTFHTAGVAEKTVTLGVPRLKELIDTSRHIKTPSVSVFFEPPYTDSEKMARVFGEALAFTVLSQVVCTSSVQLDADPWDTVIPEDLPMVRAYRAMYKDDDDDTGDDDTGDTGDDTGGDDDDDETRHHSTGAARVKRADAGPGRATLNPSSGESRWLIRFVLDRAVLATKHLDVHHVARALHSYMGDGVQLICSEHNAIPWVIRLRVKNLGDLTENMEVDATELAHLEYACVKTIHDFLLDNAPIHGVPAIKRVIVHPHERAAVGSGGALVTVKEWMADTEGSNLRVLLGLPYIDKCRTVCNDIHEVLNVLGIEAAQQVLLDEIRAVLSFDGAYVNDRHLQLLADVMTLSGTLTAMTRHNMHKLGGSTYHHASFEETQDVLINAAAYGVYDNISGVTENLIMGMLMHGGTGCCDIVSPLSGLRSHASRTATAVDAAGSSTGAAVVVVKPLVHAPPPAAPTPETVRVKPLVIPGAAPPAHAEPEPDPETTATPEEERRTDRGHATANSPVIPRAPLVVVRPLRPDRRVETEGKTRADRTGNASGRAPVVDGTVAPYSPSLAPALRVVVRPLKQKLAEGPENQVAVRCDAPVSSKKQKCAVVSSSSSSSSSSLPGGGISLTQAARTAANAVAAARPPKSRVMDRRRVATGLLLSSAVVSSQHVIERYAQVGQRLSDATFVPLSPRHVLPRTDFCPMSPVASPVKPRPVW